MNAEDSLGEELQSPTQDTEMRTEPTRDEYSDYEVATNKSFSEDLKNEADAFFGTQQYQVYKEVIKEAEAQMPNEVILPLKIMLLEKVVKGTVTPNIDSMNQLKSVFREGIRAAFSEQQKPMTTEKQQETLNKMTVSEQEFWLAGWRASASLDSSGRGNTTHTKDAFSWLKTP